MSGILYEQISYKGGSKISYCGKVGDGFSCSRKKAEAIFLSL